MARLNYHHLYYFWRVAHEGNLTKVAKSIPVSQSALSSQIQQLEETFGTHLFQRDGRRLLLTQIGTRVLGFADEIFSKGEELESLLLRGIETPIQALRIGMITTLSRNFIDALISPVLKLPNIKISIHADNIPGLLDGLARHQLDVALTDSDIKGGDSRVWQSQLLASHRVSVIGKPGFKLGSRFPKGYENMSWILPTREHEIRRGFESLCARWNFTPMILAEANDMAMLRLLARNSGGLAVLPTVVVRDELSQGTLKVYAPLPNLYGDFYAITVRRNQVPPLLQTLLTTPRGMRATRRTGAH